MGTSGTSYNEMATVEQGLRSQIQNIEATYGRSIDEWIELIRASGWSRHGEIVAMLKELAK